MTVSAFFLLIGERDPFMQRMLEHTLKDHFQVSFTDNGAALLQQTRQQHPDLVMLEILLPVLDGLEVCRLLKQDPATRHIPVVFHTLVAAEEEALQAGADGFLLKPMPPQEIITSLENILRPTSPPP